MTSLFPVFFLTDPRILVLIEFKPVGSSQGVKKEKSGHMIFGETSISTSTYFMHVMVSNLSSSALICHLGGLLMYRLDPDKLLPTVSFRKQRE